MVCTLKRERNNYSIDKKMFFGRYDYEGRQCDSLIIFFLKKNPDLLHDFAFGCEADTQERDRFDLKKWSIVVTHQIYCIPSN